MKPKKKAKLPKLPIRRPARHTEARKWPSFYVGLQIFVVVLALAAITRCSPLSPSVNAHGEEKSASLSATSPGNAASVAGEAAARQQLLAIIDQSAIITTIQVIEIDSLNRVERDPTALASISLTDTEQAQLAAANEVEISLLAGLRAMNLKDGQVAKAFQAVRQSPSDSRYLTIKVYVAKKPAIALSNGRGKLAFNEIDGIVRISASIAQESIRNLIASARRVDVDIRSN